MKPGTDDPRECIAGAHYPSKVTLCKGTVLILLPLFCLCPKQCSFIKLTAARTAPHKLSIIEGCLLIYLRMSASAKGSLENNELGGPPPQIVTAFPSYSP